VADVVEKHQDAAELQRDVQGGDAQGSDGEHLADEHDAAIAALTGDAHGGGAAATDPSAEPEIPFLWYVVHTFSGYENSVRRALDERIKKNGLEAEFREILVPSEEVTERRGARTAKVQRKFFPGYMFVNMQLTKRSWSLVKNTPRVTDFLGGQEPKPIRESEIARMLGHTKPETAPAETARVEVHYKVGDQVRVKSGAFANFTGEVEEVNDDKRKIWLSVSIFGRPTRVEVDFSEVEASAPA
jgi:transcriptional antiterminator NusG